MSELTDMADAIRSTTTAAFAVTTSGARRGIPAAPLPPIGLSGFAGAGKTEAARFIEQNWGYLRQHIAEPFRRMLASLLREYEISEEMIQRYLTGDLKESLIPELGVTSRHLQIAIGQWGRHDISPDVWAKLWEFQSQRAGGAVMNDSVRQTNEESSIRRQDGITILITRPGTGPVAFKWKRVGPLLYRWFGCMWGVHDSERVDRLRPDYVVVNDGSIAQLHFKINAILARALR